VDEPSGLLGPGAQRFRGEVGAAWGALERVFRSQSVAKKVRAFQSVVEWWDAVMAE